jgi:extracellular factor (EF) 3-hydroxypalmitic acid methyl ester biosynthesis protein
MRERAVKVGGSVVFTNIAEENPFRVWMETIADWRLIHRSEPDLRRIVEAAGFDLHGLRIQRDGPDTPDPDRKGAGLMWS